MGIELPDVTGLSVFQAALAFAEAKIPVAPFDPKIGTGKNVGNLLGNAGVREVLGLPDGASWYDYATTNRSTLTRWNQVLPFEAIATSPGRFSAIALDIDRPELFPTEHRQACKETAHVLTRGKRRGHYYFTLPAGAPPIGNPCFEYGEVRCLSGGLVLPPHPNDSRHVAKAGKLSELPTDLLVSIAGAGGIGPRVDLDTFCARFKENRYPHKLKGLVGLHSKLLAKSNPHDAMREALRIGLGEAVIGFIPARAVLETLREHWGRGNREFLALAVWCATVAASADPKALEACSRRLSGSDSRRYARERP